MAGPPKDVPASELWAKLSQRPRPMCTIDFPTKHGTESPGRVAIWILTASEENFVRSAAAKVAREFCGDQSRSGDAGYEDIYRNEVAFQLVCMACRDVANPSEPAFLHPILARQKLTTDEIAQLLSAYNAFRVESGPMLAELTPAEIEAWIAKLQEGSSRVPLSSCSGEALIDLVMSLVARLPKPSTAIGSAGSLPEENSGSTSVPSASDLVSPEELSAR